jgi:hypothetical protein
MFGPKLIFCVVSHHFVDASTPLQNRVLDAVWPRVWANETVVEFYSQNTTLGPKLTFWVVSHRLVVASAPLQNGALECRLGTSSGR